MKRNNAFKVKIVDSNKILLPLSAQKMRNKKTWTEYFSCVMN